MRYLLLALLIAPAAVQAQSAGLTTADSALIHQILAAEDASNAADAALQRGLSHGDERVRVIARRAAGRIRDSLFASRDSLPLASSAVRWPEPAWRRRYRAMAPYRDECAVLAVGLRDSVWAVRLRAAAMARESCAANDAIVATLRGWVDALPADVSRRAAGGVSWHAAAHGLVALARLRPAEARDRLARVAAHEQWHVRLYAARAAAVLSDTATLLTLAGDPNDNVKEAAIVALDRLTGHASDDVYLAALESPGAQAVRAAAIALKGSPRADVAAAAMAAYQRWRARANDSERDARQALLEAAGRPASDDKLPRRREDVPRSAVALALGADARLRVEMADAGGGGAFTVRLRGDVAPIMAARILELARRGHYDNGTWHRVEHDFVIQGGTHGDNEYVGHSSFLRDELSTLPHPRGTVGMSTRGHDTGDAQWFINLRDNPRLVRDYTIFAEVIEGMDVVDGIMEGDMIRRVTILAAPDRPARRS